MDRRRRRQPHHAGYVTTEAAHSAQYCWKGAELRHRHLRQAAGWRFDYHQAYYSAWYWRPTDYQVNGVDGSYINIFQWKERDGQYDPTYIVAVKEAIGSATDDAIVVHDYFGQRIIRNSTNVLVPKGRWFNITAYMDAGHAEQSDGTLIVWLDGQQIYSLSNICMTAVADPASYFRDYLMWGVGDYRADRGQQVHLCG